MARRAVLIAFCLIPLSLAPTPISGQELRGSVRFSITAEPLAEVVVEAWAVGRRVAFTVTDSSGEFRIDGLEPAGLHTLRLSRLGYHPLAVVLRPGESPPPLLLVPIPAALPGVVATAREVSCPVRDSERARNAWESARSRYRTDTDGLGFRADMLTGGGMTRADRVGLLPVSALRSFEYRADGRAIEPLIRAGGYAERGVGGVLGSMWGPARGDLDDWAYVLLHGRHAYHFASDLFGGRHALTVVAESDSELVIGFCPRNRRVPAIEGVLVVDPDAGLVSAEWSFLTRRPAERASGEVVFAPPAVGGSPGHLSAARGVFWRRDELTGTHHHRVLVFLGWSRGAGRAQPPGG